MNDDESKHGWPTGKERMRRRAPPERMGIRTGLLSVKDGFTADQLKELGAVLLEWNELEEWAGRLFSACLDLDNEISTRVTKAIVGHDARFSIIRLAIKKMPEDLAKLCKAPIDRLSDYKKIRDTLGHCRMWDEKNGIAESSDDKGRLWEVLVTSDALTTFWNHLNTARNELLPVTVISDCKSPHRDFHLYRRET